MKEERRKQKLKKDSLKVEVEVMANNEFFYINFTSFIGKENFRGRNKGENIKKKVSRFCVGASVVMVWWRGGVVAWWPVAK